MLRDEKRKHVEMRKTMRVAGEAPAGRVNSWARGESVALVMALYILTLSSFRALHYGLVVMELLDRIG